ncbi:MAG TPA: AAA family ATPase [Mycobacteriales bacterium]|nr:AAA family ATPase [Mycobacteriales bacterium]
MAAGSRWWRAEQLRVLDEAIAVAGSGSPTVLAVEGDAGQGKTALLEELTAHCRDAGFQLVAGEAHESGGRSPGDLLRRLGVTGAATAAAVDPFEMAQDLRELIDRAGSAGPVVVAVDDLQWADPESVAALAWLVRRTAGDRLLVVAAARPIRPPAHPQWRRLLAGWGRVVRLRLTGLSAEDAAALMRGVDPDVDLALAGRLWEHAAGNPLYLTALLQEHDAAELRRMSELPAPADLVQTVAHRLARVGPDSVALVRAVAVLGAVPGVSWAELPVAAELAEVADPRDALGLLVDAGWLERRWSGAETSVRFRHAVVRAAIHDDIPPDRRRALHLRAAVTVAPAVLALEHRFAATERYDDGLAGDMAAYAGRLHAEGDNRTAAAMLRRAGRLTADPGLRESRWLDSLFEQLLARDLDDVTPELAEVAWARDEVRRALVQGLRLVLVKRWVEARHVLEAVGEPPLAASDPRSRYRLEVLLAWVRIAVGVPGAQVLERLARIDGEQEADAALAGYLTMARRQAQVQLLGPGEGEAMVRALPEFPAHQRLNPAENYQLAWAGSICAAIGWTDRAVRDLRRFQDNLREGLADASDHGFAALLGYAQWMGGDWAEAGVTLRVCAESRFGPAHPLVAATLPLSFLAFGDVPSARSAWADARARLLAAPWPVAVQIVGVTGVLLAELADDGEQRRSFVADLERDFGAELIGLGPGLSPLWTLHLGLAMVWAGRWAEATALAQRLDDSAAVAGWTGGGAAWLRGLVAEGERRHDAARAELQTATAMLRPLPLHRAHSYADLARVESGTAASAARAAAVQGYERLGARVFLDRLDAAGSGVEDVLALLSDRERAVAVLLTRGLSYAQMARELYVTRSTVAYHLGNIYAKTNTSSRHELVDAVRGGT